jgi:DNA-binding LytR/AlgR family response regulator
MIHCLIVDDEPLALDLLEDNIRRIPYLKLVAKCKNVADAIQLLQNAHIDLVFTDIQMPGLNGLQFIETLQHKPMFIMHTAFEQFALEGYKLDVIDYLLKPVSFERFLQACNKASDRFNTKKLKEATRNLSIGKSQSDYIFVYIDYSLIKVLLDEIKYIEAQKDYIKIHFVPFGKKALLVRSSMKGIEEMLPADIFIRIHKSYIVNTNQVTAVRKNAVFLGTSELPVSEQYKDSISKITNGNFLI